MARNVALVRAVHPKVRAESAGSRLAALLTCRKRLTPAKPLIRPPRAATVTSVPDASLVATFAKVRVVTPALSSVRIVRIASTVCRKKGVTWTVVPPVVRCSPSSYARMYSGFRNGLPRVTFSGSRYCGVGSSRSVSSGRRMRAE